VRFVRTIVIERLGEDGIVVRMSLEEAVESIREGASRQGRVRVRENADAS
jgi:hypothetical protein